MYYGIFLLLVVTYLLLTSTGHISQVAAICLWSYVNYRMLIGGRKHAEQDAAYANNVIEQYAAEQAPYNDESAGTYFCPQCGSKLLPGGRFCDMCGAKLP